LSKNKIIKSVSFNITNVKDQEYLKRIDGINFSGYVKKLIEKDIKMLKGQRNERGGIKIVVGNTE
jgi:hypothetical protein